MKKLDAQIESLTLARNSIRGAIKDRAKDVNRRRKSLREAGELQFTEKKAIKHLCRQLANLDRQIARTTKLRDNAEKRDRMLEAKIGKPVSGQIDNGGI